MSSAIAQFTTYLGAYSPIKALDSAILILEEAYATFRYVLPAAVEWMWKSCKGHITSIELKILSNRITPIGTLYILGDMSTIAANSNVKSLLLIAGDHAHPYSLYPFVEDAEKEGYRVFALRIGGMLTNLNIENYKDATDLVKMALETMDRKIIDDCKALSEKKIIFGHSAGGILGAEALTKSQINSAFVVGAPLRIVAVANDPNAMQTQPLAGEINAIADAILKNPGLPLQEQIPSKDWCVYREFMGVGRNWKMIPGGHLGAIYSDENKQDFREFLRQA